MMKTILAWLGFVAMMLILCAVASVSWAQVSTEEESSPESVSTSENTWTPVALTRVLKNFSEDIHKGISDDIRLLYAPTGYTCSALCAYSEGKMVLYDPTQDIVVSTAANAGQAYSQAIRECFDSLQGTGKLKDKSYAILVIETATTQGAVPVRATVNNACVKN
jgi:hypothetical protein